MKIKLIIMLAIVMASCSEKINYIEITPPSEDREYISHYYYSYVNRYTIDKDVMNLDDFNPGALKLKGDTLLFSDNTSNSQAVYLFSIKNKKVLRKIQDWQYNGKTQLFPNSKIEDIETSGDKLYVANMQSQIDVFNLNSGDFITRIGTGAWGDGNYQILHSHAIVVKDDRLYVRTKNRMHTYLLKDITFENYQKIKWECRTSTTGFEVNNPFNPYQMVDGGDKIWITEMTGMNKIVCIDPTKVEAGNDKNIIDDNSNINLNFAPTGLAFHTPERLFIAQNDGPIHILDMNSKSIVHTMSQVYGSSFSASKLEYGNGYLIVADKKNKKIFLIEVMKHEIKEYE